MVDTTTLKRMNLYLVQEGDVSMVVAAEDETGARNTHPLSYIFEDTKYENGEWYYQEDPSHDEWYLINPEDYNLFWPEPTSKQLEVTLIGVSEPLYLEKTIIVCNIQW
jgi:hypothetical protein